MLFEQIAEIVRILITDVERNIAHAAVALGQQMLCRLDADSGQIFDKGLTGLLRKHGRKMVRTKADLCRHHVQRNTAVRIVFADKLLCTADFRAVSHILMAITQTSHAAEHLGGTGLCALERRRLTEHRLRVLRRRNAACLHLISQLRGCDEQIHQQIIPVQHALHVLRRRVAEITLDNTRHVLGSGMPQLVRQ